MNQEIDSMSEQEPIIVVSGLPRSGTSMMMRMLEAGGIPILSDHVRAADEDNPKGYYEFEAVKKLETDTSWLPSARGRAVKMVSMLLYHLPADYRYKIVFMLRDLREVLASQAKMLERSGRSRPDAKTDALMEARFADHLEKVSAWLREQAQMDVLHVSYNDMVTDPSAYLPSLNAFLGGGLDIDAMRGVVAPDLYRQRRGEG